MALKATVFKADLSVADIDRGYYRDHALTLARHPSETDERMMVRLLAFALHADDALAFGRGLSAEDEADLVRRDLTGAVELWIDVGLPDERDLRKACGRSPEVHVYAYGGRACALWWEKARPRARAAAVARRPRGAAGSEPRARRAGRAHDEAAMHDPGRPRVRLRRRAHGGGRASDAQGRRGPLRACPGGDQRGRSSRSETAIGNRIDELLSS